MTVNLDSAHTSHLGSFWEQTIIQFICFGNDNVLTKAEEPFIFENIPRIACRFGFFFLPLRPYNSDAHVYNKQESEVNKPEYGHNREERMQAVIDAASATKESAIKFLIEAGILEPSGQLAPHLR